jgi:proteasome lid subunit RPN8/RPN11
LIRIPGQIRASILTHAANCEPEECCGLLASDRAGRIRFAYPLTNDDRSGTSFTINARESYHAFLHADSVGWEISGDFHSHPRGPSHLSERDIALAPDPTWLHLLLSPIGLKAFRIADGAPEEVEVL